MPGLVFEEQAPIAPSAPNRMDIALMVGFVRMRPGAKLPAGTLQWLKDSGWMQKRYSSRVDGLLDVPILIDNWGEFDQLFAWEQRDSAIQDGATYLGSAVRSFFAQGGRRCYVVRAGDPTLLEAKRASRLDSLTLLLPGYPNGFAPSPADRESWHGMGHLFGLPDVSFVCLPDLPEAVGVDRQRVPLPDPPPGPREVFVECSIALPAPPPDLSVRDVSAPTCDDQGYSDWASAVNLVTSTLARRNREAEFVAALPMPQKTVDIDGLQQAGLQRTAFLQLVYPWVTTPGSFALPENVEPADGAFTGILARNSLTRGTYHTAANLHVGDISALFPRLGRQEQDALEEDISLIGPTPSGLKLLSDVTTSTDQSYRCGSVSRLIASVVRTARRIGEDSAFEPSGARVWGEVRERLNSFLLGLYHADALRGSSPGEAYNVKCDRSTMTQNDLDEGRLIAVVQLDPAAPIDTITVVLSLNENRLALAPAGGVA